MNINLIIGTALSGLLLINCSNLKKDKIDLIVHNGTIYMVDQQFQTAEAMAIDSGRILAIGAEHEIRNRFQAREQLDLRQKFVYPGFIDAHCHFVGLGPGMQQVDLTGTTSWEDCLLKVREYAKKRPDGWITGRGWDQNDWEVKEFPTNIELSEMFPYRPVFLIRIDGHAAVANALALSIANVDPARPIAGGEFVMKDGRMTGVMIDHAVDRVKMHIPQPDKKELAKAIFSAQEKCFEHGVTSVSDAGLTLDVINTIEELYESGSLAIRMYIMVADDPASLDHFLARGPVQTDQLTIKSVKCYMDGALGSRGAALLKPYSDDPDNYGLLLQSKEEFERIARLVYNLDFQLNTHCIGDSANRMVLEVYSDILQGPNDRRWRIEHAQIVDPEDLNKFKNYTVIPSVQPTHATSDMYWAEDRIGAERIKHAYAWKDLLDQNGIIALGTDFPVEDVSALKTFHAAVFRQDAMGYPEGGFQMENALTREQAIRGMTIWNAIANFEEEEKGSLEIGKVADFIVLNKNLMNVSGKDFESVKVEQTYVNGKQVFAISK
ncbi:MAG TPA: amidohydrolase [Flavobacteriales bacterium]|jgi:predicted amidohydrolase YtcJ|nr:amidohydrolase [Flavobacteriales bacterium]